MTTAAIPNQTAAEPRHRFRPGTARAALSYRTFRILFAGSALSSVGTWMQNFTLPAYLDDRTGSAALVGLLVFMQLGPLMLLSLPAGVLADRLDRTKLVIAMQLVMLVASLLLALQIAVHAPLWTLFVSQLVIGSANALNAPAFSASLPMLVDRADLPGAVSLNSAMINGSRVMGPALAALLATLGFSTAQLFVVNSATFLFMIVPLLFLALPVAPVDHPERGWRRLTTGLNIVRRRQVLSRSLIAMCLFSLVCLPFVGLFPSIARMNLGVAATSATYKWLYVVWGLGAFLGALAVGTWLARFDRRRLATVGFVGFGLSLAVFALMRSAGPAFPVAAVLGFVYFMTATCLITVIQENVHDGERAAVMPLWFMAFGGTVPVGNIVAGPIVDAVGARPVLLFGAAFALVLARWADLARLPADAYLGQHRVDVSEPTPMASAGE